jgi:hypothetical protein
LKQYLYKKKKAGFSLLVYLCLSIHLLNGQGKPSPEYQVKAAFLYNFTRFISWPAASFRSANSPFIIGIIGNDPFGNYIEEIAKGEKVDGHPIMVQRYHNLKDVLNCHLLFIHSPATGKAKEIVALTGRKSILTVSDDEGFTQKGGMINFYRENNKIRFEVNIQAAKNADLELSSKFLGVAKISQAN